MLGISRKIMIVCSFDVYLNEYVRPSTGRLAELRRARRVLLRLVNIGPEFTSLTEMCQCFKTCFNEKDVVMPGNMLVSTLFKEVINHSGRNSLSGG